MSNWFPVPAVPLMLIGAAALIAALAVWVRSKRRTRVSPVASVPSHNDVWVIANPIKPENYDVFRREVDALCQAITGKVPCWLETTPQDPGTGAALEALRHDPRIVLVAGGDGTVRAVAAALAYSGKPMGILPIGTGNLTARNLRVPLDLPSAMVAALTGTAKPVDLAWLRMERVETPAKIPAEGQLLKQYDARRVRYLPPGKNEPREDEFAYLVIAGIGFDGETMARTSSKMKKTVGWVAYVISAMRALRIERMKTTLTLYSPGGGQPDYPPWMKVIPAKMADAIGASHTLGEENPSLEVLQAHDDLFAAQVRARTILFANCGELPFVTLAPDAKMDDGALDVIAIDTKAGLAGWFALAVKVLSQGIGVRPFNTRHDWGQIAFQQVREARVDVSKAHQVQVDGDALGTARTVIARVDSGALLVSISDEASAQRVAAAYPAIYASVTEVTGT